MMNVNPEVSGGPSGSDLPPLLPQAKVVTPEQVRKRIAWLQAHGQTDRAQVLQASLSSVAQKMGWV